MLKKIGFNLKIVIVLVCLASLFILFGFFKDEHRASEEKQTIDPRPVKYIKLAHKQYNESRRFPGIVKVTGETNLGFRVGGQVEKFLVVTGQTVKKNQVIAVIDSRDFKVNYSRLEASLEEAEATFSAMEKGARQEDIDTLTAQVSAAKANLSRSQKQKQRYDQLINEQIVTQSQYDEVLADFKTRSAQYNMAVQDLKKARAGSRKEDIQAARARIKQLKATILSAQNSINDTVLKAPFDGIINDRLVEKFDTVSPGQPVVTILDNSSIEIKAALPEEILLKRADIEKIECTLDAYPGKRFSAQIKEIGLKTNAANQSFPLTVSLENLDKIDIQAGMSASVNVEFLKSKNETQGFLVPATSLFVDETNQLNIWKINKNNLTVSKTRIQSRKLAGDQVFIMSDLKPGDLVITAGARFLIPGQEIRMMDTI